MAIGFDIDPISAREARMWAVANGLDAQFHTYTGGLEALGSVQFDLVVANLIRTELSPLIPGITSAMARGSQVILSGLLQVEQQEVIAAFNDHDVVLEDFREEEDDSGISWVSLLMRASY